MNLVKKLKNYAWLFVVSGILLFGAGWQYKESLNIEYSILLIAGIISMVIGFYLVQKTKMKR